MSLGPEVFDSAPDNLINGGFPLVGASVEVGESQTIKRGTLLKRGAASFSIVVSDADGGTFTISALGKTTAGIARTASAANVKTALETTFGAGNAGTSGGALGTNPVVITFAGELAGAGVVLTADGSELTGEGAAVTVTEAAGSQTVTKVTSIPAVGIPLFVSGEAATTESGESQTVVAYATGQFNSRAIDCDSVVLAGIREHLRSKGIHLSESIAAA